MALEDTAVAEEVTGSPAAAQEVQETTPVPAEIAPVGTEAETKPTVATETGERQPPDLDGLSDEEIAELPAVKGLLARHGESQRQRALSEAETRRQVEVSRYHVAETYVDEFNQMVKAAVEAGEEIKPGVLRARLNALLVSRDEFSSSTVLDIINGMISPDIPVTKATADRYNGSHAAYRAKRINLPELVQYSVLALAEQVAEAKIKPALEKVWKQEWEQGQETERLRRNGQTRSQQRGPTPLQPGRPGGTGFVDLESAEAAYTQGRITTAQMRDLRNTLTYSRGR